MADIGDCAASQPHHGNMSSMRRPDAELVPRLSRARGFDRVVLAASVGDAEGETGPQALRSLLLESGTGSSDLKCAALLALAKRCGEEASGDYKVAFDDKDSGTRDYAVLALAAFGADGHWDRVADRLAKTLARRDRTPGEPSNVVLMIIYLARHAGSQPERVRTLAGLLRKRWERLHLDEERQWVLRFWPEVAPTDSPASAVSPPDGQAMQRWIKDHPLFEPLTN